MHPSDQRRAAWQVGTGQHLSEGEGGEGRRSVGFVNNAEYVYAKLYLITCYDMRGFDNSAKKYIQTLFVSVRGPILLHAVYSLADGESESGRQLVRGLRLERRQRPRRSHHPSPPSQNLSEPGVCSHACSRESGQQGFDR